MSISEGNPEQGSETRGEESPLCTLAWLQQSQCSGAGPERLIQAQKLPGVLGAPGSPELTVGDHDAQ